jgi:hypothetical protein
MTAATQIAPGVGRARAVLEDVARTVTAVRPTAEQLQAAGRRLAEWAPEIDLAAAREESARLGRSVILERVPAGPVLAARWFPAGVATTIHAHGTWGAMAVVDGIQQYEQWEATGDGAARLVEERLLKAGDMAHWSPPADLHRQEGLRPGALSLIVLGREPVGRSAPTYRPADALDRAADALRRYDLEELLRLCRPDVLLDANVPQWRMQLRGPDAIRSMVEEEVLGLSGLRVTASRVHRSTGARTVEVEAHFAADGEERLWREVHLLRGDATGVAEHTIYCTGIWDGDTITRHAAEAPMEQW